MVYLYIALFSMIGALSRYGVSLMIDAPTYTVIVNLLGALLLGFCTNYFKSLNMNALLKTGITTGFLGSFTTFSALSKDAVDLYLAHSYAALALYLSITMIGGLICVVLGMKWGDA
ncbi:fluoride efflux transporter FluC [Macrococcus animalis]|uniref:fluoride efflux transporter FluC n=1 Tax=Macrococcus animalis TaxID=3395467 RepID=UPI0039BDA4F8